MGLRISAIRVRVAFGLLALLVAAILIGGAPIWLLGAYLVMGALSALLYGRDKRAARRGAWRTSEGTLHGIDLLCGIGGGLVAQEAFRHKTAKRAFGVTTWAIAVLHGLVFIEVALFGWDWAVAVATHLLGATGTLRH
jgi:uncharacterized membrane protein YsdA (DUF1294 family)